MKGNYADICKRFGHELPEDSLSENQRRLREVCGAQNWPGKTCRPQCAGGRAHVFVSAQIADELAQTLVDHELQGHHVVVSEEHLDLVRTLLLEDLPREQLKSRGARQPKVWVEETIPLPAISFLEAKCVKRTHYPWLDVGPRSASGLSSRLCGCRKRKEGSSSSSFCSQHANPTHSTGGDLMDRATEANAPCGSSPLSEGDDAPVQAGDRLVDSGEQAEVLSASSSAADVHMVHGGGAVSAACSVCSHHTRQTHSTGSRPRDHEAGAKTYGPRRKNVPLPAFDVRLQGDAGAEPASLSARTQDTDLTGCLEEDVILMSGKLNLERLNGLQGDALTLGVWSILQEQHARLGIPFSLQPDVIGRSAAQEDSARAASCSNWDGRVSERKGEKRKQTAKTVVFELPRDDSEADTTVPDRVVEKEHPLAQKQRPSLAGTCNLTDHQQFSRTAAVTVAALFVSICFGILWLPQ